MLAYFDQEQHRTAQAMGRYHPWSVTLNTPDGRYVDFKELPNEIEATLEDLHHAGSIELKRAIVDFISWANGPACTFETNDFGLRPLRKNGSATSTKALEQMARVTVFFRDLSRNTLSGDLIAFAQEMELTLKVTAPQFESACWGWCLWPHLFLALGDENTPEAEGNIIQYMVWAWGNSETEVQDNMIRAFVILQQALNETVATISMETKPTSQIQP